MDTLHRNGLCLTGSSGNIAGGTGNPVSSFSNLSPVGGKPFSVYDSTESMAVGFGEIFPSYFVGLATSLFLRAYAEHLKRKELAKGPAEVEILNS
mgnify:CR=1 FL=1